jgi:hypothetical protein
VSAQLRGNGWHGNVIEQKLDALDRAGQDRLAQALHPGIEVADPARRLDREIGIQEMHRGGELGQPAHDARDERAPADRHAPIGELGGEALEADIADVHGASGSARPS